MNTQKYKKHINNSYLIVFLLLQIFNPKVAVSENQLEKISIQLKWKHQFQFAGYYAAKEKGFYRDAGLDVDIIEGASGINFVDEVVSGRANFGIEMPDLMLEFHKGKPIVVLAAIYQHSPLILLSKKSSGILSPHDLFSKRIMLRIESGSSELYAMIKKEGLDINSLNFIKHSFDLNDLASDKVDLFSIYNTVGPYRLKEMGYEPAVLMPINYGVDFYGDCIFTSRKELASNKDRVHRFLEATFNGWEYAMSHPDEMYSVLQKKYHTLLSVNALKNEYEVSKRLILPELVEIGHMNYGRWEHIAEIYMSLGMLPKNFSFKEFIYDPEKEEKEFITAIVYGATAIASVLVIVFFIMLFFNRRLNAIVVDRTFKLEQEIKERKKNEERINIALQEKSTLLKEVHHRVKNNLQVVSSLIDLQSGEVRDDYDRDLFTKTSNRIYSIARIHEKLYKNEDLASINFIQYLKELAIDLRATFILHDMDDIVLNIDSPDLFLNLELAVPCGLIANELISNVYKHAFKDRKNGVIDIGLILQDGNYILTVADNGNGFPKNLDIKNPKSLGLQLVKSLAWQIRGKLDVNCEKGCRFTIVFPKELL